MKWAEHWACADSRNLNKSKCATSRHIGARLNVGDQLTAKAIPSCIDINDESNATAAQTNNLVKGQVDKSQSLIRPAARCWPLYFFVHRRCHASQSILFPAFDWPNYNSDGHPDDVVGLHQTASTSKKSSRSSRRIGYCVSICYFVCEVCGHTRPTAASTSSCARH